VTRQSAAGAAEKHEKNLAGLSLAAMVRHRKFRVQGGILPFLHQRRATLQPMPPAFIFVCSVTRPRSSTGAARGGGGSLLRDPQRRKTLSGVGGTAAKTHAPTLRR